MTAPRTSRAISATQVEEIAAHYANKSTTIADAERSYRTMLFRMPRPDDVIFITGSLYLVGQLRHYLKKKRSPQRPRRKTPETP